MKKIFLFLTAAVSAVCNLFAMENPAYGPLIRFGYASAVPSGVIRVDGKLDEEVWKKAEKFTDFRRNSDQKVSQKSNVVMTAFDTENLYIAWILQGKPNVCHAVSNDSGAIFGDETLEFFFGDPQQPMSFRQFALTPANKCYDAQDRDSYINFAWQSAVMATADGWQAEMAIPWKTLGVSPDQYRYLRLNFARSRHSADGSAENSSWSMVKKGYNEIAGFGFLIFGSARSAVEPDLRQLAEAAKPVADKAAVVEAMKHVNVGKPEQFIDFQNRLVHAQQTIRAEKTQAASAGLEKKKDRAPLLLSNWDENVELEASKEFQLPLLVQRVKNPDPAKLAWEMAINEFAHRSFLISALQQVKEIKLTAGNLLSADGHSMIPASKIRFYRIGFLRPAKELWPSSHAGWSGRPLPELVEEVDVPFSLDKYASAQIRVLIDSTDVKAGKYRGKLTVSAASGMIGEIPVECEVLPFSLPDNRTNPFCCNIFTQIPFGGKSGRAYAKFFREHYVSQVTFETPRMYLNGKLIVPAPHIKDSTDYLNKIIHHGLDFSGKLEIDGNFSDIADRLRICREYGLKPVFSTRVEDILPDAFPELIRFLARQGIHTDQFIYKMGDEDTSLWQQPLAERIHHFSPEVPLFMIPSGKDYFDLKPLAKHYKFIAFTRAGLSNPEFEKDLRCLQAQGVRLARYTNRTSWAERDVRLAGREDLWDVMIRDRMDGFLIWTACCTGAWLHHRYAYGGAARRPVFDFLPEEQSTCSLVYIRKQGDSYKPVSCIRLEDMRDGITDYFYYKAAEKSLAERKDPNAEKKLEEVVFMPRKNPADFAKTRKKMISLILEK